MEPNQDNLTENTLPDAAQLTAAGGDAAVADTLSLTELNQILGKDFKDKATALKAVKDTFSYVGKKTDAANPAPAPATDPNLVATVQQLQEQLFYTQNPQYKGYEHVIKAMGSNPAEVVNLEAFKTVFEKVKVADEVQQQKSVVASNSRIAASPETSQKAVELANSAQGSKEILADFLANQILSGDAQ